MRKKYDWQKIKLDFFLDEWDVVKEVVGRLLGGRKKCYEKNTKWRADEKKKYKEMILKRALEENAEKEIQDLSVPLNFLMKAKKNALIKIALWINNSTDIWKLVKWLNSIKTELWEPTNISKNDTTIRRDPLDEDLFIQD